jgi:hypothetical protein
MFIFMRNVWQKVKLQHFMREQSTLQGLIATSVTEGGTQTCPKYLRLSKYTDMTIHWKARKDHFPMVPLVFRLNYFQGGNIFSEFFSKNLIL